MNSYTKLPIFSSRLTTSTIAVYLYLEKHGARKNKCFHSIKTISTSLNLSPTTVKKAINSLEHNGFIIRTHQFKKDGGKSSNLYQLIK